MALNKITFNSKNTGDEFSAANANEIKSIVNPAIDEINSLVATGTTVSTDVASLKTNVTTLTNNVTAITTRVTNVENNKVDKETGKGLSKNDFTDAYKTKVDGLSNYNDSAIQASLTNKVDKVSGKGLSTNDYTAVDKNKLDGLTNYNDSALSARVTAVETSKATEFKATENQYGVHPAFASQLEFNRWVIQQLNNSGNTGGGTTEAFDYTFPATLS